MLFFCPLLITERDLPVSLLDLKSETNCSEDRVIRTPVKLQQIPTLYSYKLANVLQVLKHKELERIRNMGEKRKSLKYAEVF